MDAGRAGALGLADALVVAAREVVQVGLRDRERHVGGVQLVEELELLLGAALGLDPGAELPRRRVRRLAPGHLRESPQDVGRLRTGEEPQAEPVGRRRGRRRQLLRRRVHHLDAPALGAVEAEVAGVGVVDEHPEAVAREQPRDRVVGRVVARPQPPRGYELSDQRILVRLVGAVGDVILDHVAALVDGVRALPEAKVALAGVLLEPDPKRGRRQPAPEHFGVELDHVLPGG